jgi:hypothetical protein
MRHDARKAEADHPHAVWIRIPVGGPIQQQRLEHAAGGIGAHAISRRLIDGVRWFRFGFAASAHAAQFRAEAQGIVGPLVEAAEPGKPGKPGAR